jgi:hypothetical protein
MPNPHSILVVGSAGAFIYDRLEMIRENLKLLNGHLHFVTRPGEGYEISMCLA